MEKLRRGEIIEIGAERYIHNNSGVKKIILVGVGLGLALLTSTLLENRILEWLRTLITILTLVIFTLPYLKLVVIDAQKMGRHFYQEFKAKYPDIVQEETK